MLTIFNLLKQKTLFTSIIREKYVFCYQIGLNLIILGIFILINNLITIVLWQAILPLQW
ncbi:MAG: hypothetical protein RLZZ175_2092 [Bacteroidota bacterium]|jgi:hypothetical protein